MCAFAIWCLPLLFILNPLFICAIYLSHFRRKYAFALSLFQNSAPFDTFTSYWIHAFIFFIIATICILHLTKFTILPLSIVESGFIQPMFACATLCTLQLVQATKLNSLATYYFDDTRYLLTHMKTPMEERSTTTPSHLNPPTNSIPSTSFLFATINIVFLSCFINYTTFGPHQIPAEKVSPTESLHSCLNAKRSIGKWITIDELAPDILTDCYLMDLLNKLLLYFQLPTTLHSHCFGSVILVWTSHRPFYLY